MINPIKEITSGLKSLFITLERGFDHGYRQIVGLPTLRFSEITPQLYLGGQYTSRGFRVLKSRGITGIVSLRMRARMNLPDLGEIRFLHLPTPDWHAPSLADLQKGIKFITHEIENQGKVYVHCAYGEGRGPSMVAAYLVSTGLTLEEALSQIKKVRGFIRPTIAQLERLKEVEQLYLKK